MPEQLTHSADSAKILAAAAREKPRSRAKGPPYVDIPRSILQHPELNWTDAVVNALVKWREDWREKWAIEHGEDPGPVPDARLADWIKKHRTTVQRSRKRLKRTTSLGPKIKGYVRVYMAEIRKFGVLAAIAIAQLRGWPKREDVRYAGEHFMVRAVQLAEHLGVCRKTASRLLASLRGKFADLMWANGYAAHVRILSEREQAEQPPELPKPKPPVLQLRLPRPRYVHTPPDLGQGYAHLFGPPG